MTTQEERKPEGVRCPYCNKLSTDTLTVGELKRCIAAIRAAGKD